MGAVQVTRPLLQACMRPQAGYRPMVIANDVAICEVHPPPATSGALRSRPVFVHDAYDPHGGAKQRSTSAAAIERLERSIRSRTLSSSSGMGEQLTDAQFHELKRVFDKYDPDGKGVIKAQQLATVLELLGHNPTSEELHDIAEEITVENTQSITFTDLVDFMTRKTRDTSMEAKDDLLEAFSIFDKEGKGYITEAEIRRTAKELGTFLTDDDIREMLSDVDLSLDGHIGFKEFVRMMRK